MFCPPVFYCLYYTLIPRNCQAFLRDFRVFFRFYWRAPRPTPSKAKKLTQKLTRFFTNKLRQRIREHFSIGSSPIGRTICPELLGTSDSGLFLCWSGFAGILRYLCLWIAYPFFCPFYIPERGSVDTNVDTKCDLLTRTATLQERIHMCAPSQCLPPSNAPARSARAWPISRRESAKTC